MGLAPFSRVRLATICSEPPGRLLQRGLARAQVAVMRPHTLAVWLG